MHGKVHEVFDVGTMSQMVTREINQESCRLTPIWLTNAAGCAK